ncbi:hypothetical protein FRC11_007740 [Ceratobasidium sp. 423]|nr:hypothetical protein FRC11_007740 [Ceratobasidium sp. 423]
MDKATSKAKQKEQDELNYKVATAARELEAQLNEDMKAEAKQLDFDISALCARFLMYASHHCDTQPTVWNGLIHIKSEEWADMKDLYNLAEMSDEEQDQYICAAQDAHKAKLNVGVVKTSSECFVQGMVKHEITAICSWLQYLHVATSIIKISVVI